MTTETIAIHEGRESEKVVRFMNISHLTDDALNLIKTSTLNGLYYNEEGNIVAEDIWGDVHENVVK